MGLGVLKTSLDGPGLFALRVAGTAFHSDEIACVLKDRAQAVNFQTLDVRTTYECEAVLISQPDNPHDAYAIAVLVDGKVVGYLPRDIAGRLTAQVWRRGYDTIEATCRGILSAVQSEGGSGSVSMRLDVYTHKQKQSESKLSGLQQFEFHVASPQMHVASSVSAPGARVRFWSTPTRPADIRIYPDYDVHYEDERVPLGWVPDDYVLPVLRNLMTTSSYDAKIVSRTDSGWIVDCRLYSEEEVRKQLEESENERRTRYESILEKAYRPKKPFSLRFSCKGGILRKRDIIIAERFPDIESMVKDYDVMIGFRSMRTGKVFDAKIGTENLLKLCRLRISRQQVLAHVTEVNRGGYGSEQAWVMAEVRPEENSGDVGKR